MDIAATWPGRILIFLLAFPLAMFGVPYLIASLRQRITWNKRQPADRATPSVQGTMAPDELSQRRRGLTDREPGGRFPA
ncbi:MAG: hypothetical protein PVJ48_06205 [Gammaproteobacteria bacterium]|jgi:hypothetical protein